MDIATVIGLVGTLGLIGWAMNNSCGPWRVYRFLLSSHRVCGIYYGSSHEIHIACIYQRLG